MSKVEQNNKAINQADDLRDLDKLQLIVNHLNKVLVHWRRLYLQQQLLLFLPKLLALIITLLFTVLSFEFVNIETTVATLTIVLVTGILTSLLFITRSENYASISLKNLIVYLNNRFDELEQSAQLLLVDEVKLSALERIQRGKVFARLENILWQQAKVKYRDLSPQFAKQQFILATVLLAFLFLIFIIFNSFKLLDKTMSWLQPSLAVDHTVGDNRNIKLNKTLVDILSYQVIIAPPSYSLEQNKAPDFVSESLDINTLVGSYARWTFSFSAQALDYFIVFSNGERQQLVKQKNGTYHFQRQLNTSMVYHLAVEDKATQVSEKFATIHRISLTPDQAPKIRFITPKSTVTEYGKNSKPDLATQVQISDDFAITEVSILASIAKGSGESVKFRDQIFTFDRNKLIDGKRHYYKNWSLAELAMEPGDELYFSILAKDNREPEQQLTRSTTKIIRWLEEEQSGINADGILIDFMPEYFKSQRQIIIETIELIEDNTGLDGTTFNEKSELLGLAQSALKEKYGQYLGDEFEGPQSFDENHNASQQHKPQIHLYDEQGGSSNAVITAVFEAQGADTASHAHESNTANSNRNSYASGRMELINRYGHNHEDSDVGVMTSQDPRALMKKSLTNMWQAELHLMLSEPELALSFEKKALKFLNLAKKAERIYVKRLGFEPPPVTEQRRYQGEQTDILAKTIQESRFKAEQLSNQTQLAFRQLLQLLNKFSQPVISFKLPAKLLEKSGIEKTTAIGIDDLNKENKNRHVNGWLSQDDLALIELVKSGIEKLIAKRPALVEQLVVIEQILLERQLALAHCGKCIDVLTGKLEQLLPSPISSPNSNSSYVNDQHPMIENYSQFLEDNL